MATRKKLPPGKRLGVFDTETTGLPLHARAPLKKQPHIIEFAIAIYDTSTLELLEEWSTLINPGVPITEEITKITGITQEQVSAYGVPVYAEVAGKIESLLSGCDISLAHNHPFDQSLVEFEVMRLGGTFFPWPAQRICTVEHFKPLFGKRPKLTEIYERFMGRKLDQTHRALDDVNALAAVALQERVWE